MARRRLLYLGLAALLLLATIWLGLTGRMVEPLHLRQPLASLPATLEQWQSNAVDQLLDAPTLDLLKPQDYLLRSYYDQRGRLCSVFVAYFGVQVEGAMIHSPRHCLPGGGWQIISRQEVLVPGPAGQPPHRVNQLILAQNLDRLSVLYWYQGRGRIEPDEYKDRLYLVLDGLWQHRTDGALVRLTSLQRPSDPQVLESQIRLAAAIIPALDQLLPLNRTSERH